MQRLPLRSIAGARAASARHIRPRDGFYNAVVGFSLGFGIEHRPAVDKSASAGETHALVEHFAVAHAGQHEPLTPHRRIINLPRLQIDRSSENRGIPRACGCRRSRTRRRAASPCHPWRQGLVPRPSSAASFAQKRSWDRRSQNRGDRFSPSSNRRTPGRRLRTTSTQELQGNNPVNAKTCLTQDIETVALATRLISHIDHTLQRMRHKAAGRKNLQ